MGHAYTNETQIMWNGILGEISLRAKDDISIEDLQVYPDIEKKRVQDKRMGTCCGEAENGVLRINVSEKGTKKSIAGLNQEITIASGKTLLDFYCSFGDSVRFWSEFTPVLYCLDVAIRTGTK